MDSLLKDFDIPAKNPSEEAQRRWRSAVSVVRNPRRRWFRMLADLVKRSAAQSSSSQNGLCTAAAIALFVSSDPVKTPPDFTSLEDEDETIAYAGHAPWQIEDETKTRREACNSDSGDLRRCSHGSSASHGSFLLIS